MKNLNKKKDEITKGKFDEQLLELNNKELEDFSYEFNLIIQSIPENLNNYKNLL